MQTNFSKIQQTSVTQLPNSSKHRIIIHTIEFIHSCVCAWACIQYSAFSHFKLFHRMIYSAFIDHCLYYACNRIYFMIGFESEAFNYRFLTLSHPIIIIISVMIDVSMIVVNEQRTCGC